MLKYYKQEIRDLRNPDSGKTRTVYKVKFDHSDSAEEFADYFARHSSLGPAMSQAALIDLVRCLQMRLAEVGSVSLPELGTFSVAVRPAYASAEKVMVISCPGSGKSSGYL